MKKQKGSLYAAALVVVFFALSLVLPLARGESPIDFGLDLSGGVIVTYRPDFSSRLDAYEGVSEDELLALAKETISSRLYRNLNTIPEVVVRSDRTIVASIPAVEDQERILELIGETYHLTYRLVLAKHDEPGSGEELFRYRGNYLELAEPQFSGDMLDERAIRVETGPTDTLDVKAMAPKIAFQFQPPHDEAFAAFTGDNVGRDLAILLDDRVEWVGVIESAIEDRGVLAGSYDLDEANDIAMLLKSGTMPVSLGVESLTAVGPSLGQEVKDLGLHALALSLLLLTALVAIAYLHRSALLVAGLASLFCLLFLIAGMAATFDLTLDVVGIAGIVLSIGMGMDAFIIVFESLESKSGNLTASRLKAHRERIARGMYSFTGEGRTLFHANATTLVVILLLLTTERLRSFALFIFAGIFASVLTIFITRTILRGTYGRIDDFGFDLLSGLRAFRPRIFRFRKVYFATVAVIFALTAFLLVTAGPGSLLGADFKEGTQLVLTSPEESALDAAVAALEDELPGVTVRKQRMGESGDGRYLVTLGSAVDTSIGGSDEEGVDADRIAGVFAAHSVKLESLSSIDNRVSSARLGKSLSVLLLSFFFLAVYFVAIQEPINRLFSSRGREEVSSAARFRVFWGILTAVIVDVGLIFAVLVLLGIPVSLPVVAGVLTIIGYSVNDSVVLWSHIQKRGAELDVKAPSALERVTRSVDRILSRAVLTSLSTMVPAVTILLVGLGPLVDFAWVMIAGTVAGTLSSMFVVGSFAVRALEQESGAVDSAAPDIGSRRDGVTSRSY